MRGTGGGSAECEGTDKGLPGVFSGAGIPVGGKSFCKPIDERRDERRKGVSGVMGLCAPEIGG